MKKVLFIVFAGLVLLVLVPGCKSAKVKIPSDIIPEKKMQFVLIDVLTAESYAGMHTIQADTTRKIAVKLYSEIFDKYHITREQYFNSYNFYAKHPALFEKEMTTVIDSLNAMDARVPGVYNRANIQSGPQTVRSK
jgi:hypothetical protein